MMDHQASSALAVIRRSIDAGRYQITKHFAGRMDTRGIAWPDVLALFDNPAVMRSDGVDKSGRSRWIVSGRAMDDLPMEVVCVLERGGDGEWVVLITIYWKD